MSVLPGIEPWRDGSAFQVKARAGSRRDGLAGVHDGMLKVEVTTAPEKGKANKAIVRLLAGLLGVTPGDLELLSGETASRKRFGLHGVAPDELRRRLRELLP